MDFTRLLCVCIVALFPAFGKGVPTLQLEQVLANGRPVEFSRETGVVLPPGRHDLEVRFRTQGDTPAGWIVQYQLDGYDPTWRDVDGGMALILRLLDGAGRELLSRQVPVPGQNLGFPEIQRRSNLNRRIYPLVVPSGAKFLEITFDSGTWRPELTGEWVIADVTVNRSDRSFGPKESFWLNPGLVPGETWTEDSAPKYWKRRGDAAIARLEKAPRPETGYLLTLRDFSKTGAGAWVCRQPLPEEVKSGEVLTVGWLARSRVGDERLHSARFTDVPPGRMLFRAVGRGAGAVYVSEGIALPVVIRPYVWTQPWFAPAATLLSGLALGLGLWRWLRWRYRRKLAWAESQARIEKDRMRIARDIHDDVGAQLTRLGLMCSALADGATSTQVEEIAAASRRVVQSMDEIVWAVEPSNDSLDRLGTFLCRFTDEFLEDFDVRPRYDVPADLPPAPLNAEVRHNLFLAVKESLHNALRCAAAREIRLAVAVTGGVLEISVADDGIGFDVASAGEGNGLRNMRSRLEEIGGSFHLESAPGTGTRVSFHWPLPSAS